MERELLEVIIGIILLMLIINTIGIWSYATSSNPQVSRPVVADGAEPSGIVGDETVQDSPAPAKTATAAPTATPLKPPPTPNPKKTTPVPTPETYVTIETPEPVVTESPNRILPEFARRNDTGYDTLYSLSHVNVSMHMPRITVNVVNPPLIIDYDFLPVNATDMKVLEYKQIKTYYRENLTLHRADENAYFTITVTDKDTGEIIAEDGIGKLYGLQSPKGLLIPHSGLIGIEFAGKLGTVTLSVKMKKPN